MAGLGRLFAPKSVALIGVSTKKEGAGYGVLRNMLAQCLYPCTARPYQGKLSIVHPKARSIEGVRCYASLAQIKGGVDLAIIMLPAKMVPDVLRDCAKARVRYAVIISAGFSEVGNTALEDEIAAIARDAKIRIVGPNCLGIIVPPSRLNASFSPAMPPSGRVGFISQSGAIVDAVIDFATLRPVGFSAMLSVGNQADLSVTDLLEHLGRDPHTKMIAGYLESVGDGRRFLSVCRNVSRRKPIVLIKSGRSDRGSHAAASHTGRLAGSYDVFAAACRQAGVLLVDTIEELFDAMEVLSLEKRSKKRKGVGIITNAGGIGVLATDYCEQFTVPLARYPRSLFRALDRSKHMHPAYSRHNPLDIIGDADAARYHAALRAVLSKREVGVALVLLTLQTTTQVIGTAREIVRVRKKFKKPVVCAFVGGSYTLDGVEHLRKHNVPVFTEVQRAVRALSFLR